MKHVLHVQINGVPVGLCKSKRKCYLMKKRALKYLKISHVLIQLNYKDLLSFTLGEHQKYYQQLLAILLHAAKCQKPITSCTLPHCALMKEILQHIAICKNNDECPTVHCNSSRRILTHYGQCQNLDCMICQPLRSLTAYKPAYTPAGKY